MQCGPVGVSGGVGKARMRNCERCADCLIQSARPSHLDTAGEQLAGKASNFVSLLDDTFARSVGLSLRFGIMNEEVQSLEALHTSQEF